MDIYEAPAGWLDRHEAVCRCGHGHSLHILRGVRAARGCVACEETKAVGRRSPAGYWCSGYVDEPPLVLTAGVR